MHDEFFFVFWFFLFYILVPKSKDICLQTLFLLFKC